MLCQWTKENHSICQFGKYPYTTYTIIVFERPCCTQMGRPPVCDLYSQTLQVVNVILFFVWIIIWTNKPAMATVLPMLAYLFGLLQCLSFKRAWRDLMRWRWWYQFYGIILHIAPNTCNIIIIWHYMWYAARIHDYGVQETISHMVGMHWNLRGLRLRESLQQTNLMWYC